MEHTKEPWSHRNGRIFQTDRNVLTIANIARAFDGDYSEANARRIVACVNACDGLDTSQLEQFGLGTAFGTVLFDVTAERNQLIQQNAQLLAALRDVISWVPSREKWHTDEPIKAVERARAVISATVKDSLTVDHQAPSGASAVQQLEAERARSTEPQQPSGWHRAVDEEMVLTHLGVADPLDSYETAKSKLNDLIAWHVAVATDPAVNGGYVLVPKDSAADAIRARNKEST